MEIETAFILLFVVATAVAIAARRLRLPYTVALVLAIPATFPYRELIVSMTFGVALLSILVHGLTMSGLLRWLGLVSEAGDRTAYEVRSGRVQAASTALAEIDRLSQTRSATPEILDTLREEYRRALEGAQQELQKLVIDKRQLNDGELHRIRRLLLSASAIG